MQNTQPKAPITTYQKNAREIAEMLHERMCHHNHNDYCGFYDEDWDKLELCFAKTKYLEKAKKLLDILDYDMVKKVVSRL